MKKVKIKSCLECDDHQVINDMDPNDWFCDDDMAVICRLTSNLKPEPKSKWISNRSKFKVVTCSCRPYNLEKESKVPNWCPKRK